MAKIISVSNDIVEIGEDNGTLTEVRLSDLSFAPRVGDSVDVFRSESSLRVTLAQNQHQGGWPVAQSGSGININLSQLQQSTQQSVQPQTYVQAGKVVNKITYILCAILLGGVGVHKFIAGKTGTGVVFIIFCWTL
ncbi:MAG: TM2 domain-containing protein, partial [Clostridiales bacterium]|nr:TM2 domain-containing protein [Clostridiales bacterium]